MTNFETAFANISELVKDFNDNESFYLTPNYSEADVRNDYINKFFIELGWDVRHEHQKSPYLQEVRVEKSLQVERAKRRPDYSFFITPYFKEPKFFVEAKKPSKNLEDKDYFFQVVRYGWNATTPIAVLTDFEEFIILDCRYEPDINDIFQCNIKRFHYKQYLNEEVFREIYYLFSRDSVADHSIEKFAEQLPVQKGGSIQWALFKGGFKQLDEAFLEDLDGIRLSLAKSFKTNNNKLTSEQLTEGTQRTIDRLIFIKFLEDKLIEPDSIIDKFGTKRRAAWKDFIATCKVLNAKYNGAVFQKSSIDDGEIYNPEEKVFISICDKLSSSNSPYLFHLIPVHILGSIYERFLGKVVQVRRNKVNIEEKPEVIKAGGVYYTPQFIVNYIVDLTVGKLIEGKTPNEIKNMHFADISCGSGSFLITVYEKILDYHKRWYSENLEQAKKDGNTFVDTEVVLSLKQKKEILRNNIYGVDLDSQAVEVTQLSLYLKLLEEETTNTTNNTWILFKERLLPDLSQNIVWGNSLMDFDSTLFAAGQDEEDKLIPVNFDEVFPRVYNEGGFDAIFGNPPFINAIQLSELYGTKLKKYMKEKYESAKGTYDIYIPFFERGLKLLKKGGLLGFITPNKYLSAPYGFAFRNFVDKSYKLVSITDYSSIKVFSKPAIYPVVTIIENNHSKEYTFTVGKVISRTIKNRYSLSSKVLTLSEEKLWSFVLSKNIDLITKILNHSVKLSTVTNINATSTAGEADEYSKHIKEGKKTRHFQPLINTGTINRYESLWGVDALINKGTKFMSPVIDLRMVSENRRELYITPKIIVAKVALRFECFLDEAGEYASINTNCLYNPDGVTLKTLTGLLNSKLLSFIYSEYFSGLRMAGGYFQFQAPQLRILPVPEKQLDCQLDKLVDELINTKKEINVAPTDAQRNFLIRKFKSIDRQIDKLVYGLYDLTKEEEKIVEDCFLEG